MQPERETELQNIWVLKFFVIFYISCTSEQNIVIVLREFEARNWPNSIVNAIES